MEKKTMNTNSTKSASKAPMSNREILGMKLKNIVSTNKQSVEKIGDNAWKFKDIEVDSKTYDYLVRLEAKTGKSGKTFKKRNLYRIVDGAEQKFELGEFKKEYLYKIVSGLTTTKVPRAKISHWNDSEVRSICDYIRAHQTEFKTENNVTTGTIPGIGEIKYIVGSLKPMKNCHKRQFGRKLYVNGELSCEGGGLILMDRALVSKKRGRKKAEKTAEETK
jgi:hypothetical protein